jgi:predicted histidine transporter YuiF (NhaC family)
LEEHQMFNFIIYIVVSLAVFFIVEKMVRKKWNIQNTRKSGHQGINSIHTWGNRIFWAVFFVNVVFISSGMISTMIIILLFSFDAFMLWKYKRSDKEYVISIMGLVFFIIFIAVGYTFDLLI